MATVARQVREYIAGHPSITDALKMDIVNYSALARRICKELGIRREEAVLAACRRYPVEKLRGYSEDAIRRMLKKSQVQTRTKVAAITVVEGVDVLQRLGDVVEELLDENKVCRLLQVSRGTVIIVDDTSVSRVTKKLRPEHIISVARGLVEIAVTSPETIEKTPGLLAFLSGALASRGINIVEEMSCYTDTIFILDRKDMTRAMEVLAQNLE
ncbi:MAG: ACT domain-containing protein [Methanobacteriota archaeon]|nr:MAG: ACT domain-containing protein [Euryarchaeota archaeon]